MKKDKKELREIPSKKYYFVIVVSILVVVLTLYIRSFYLNYQSSNIEDSIFHNQTINQIKIEDLNYAINEISEAILYVGYNKDKKVDNMEKRLYKEIEKNNLNDKFIYLNVTDYIENDEYLNTLRNEFSNIQIDINKAPMFIYIKDGVAVEVIDSSDQTINYKTFDSLLIKYGIE